MLNNKNIFYFEIWVIKNADTFFSQMKILHRSCGEVDIEKWGFFTGLEIFLLLFLQFKEILALPGKGDIGGKKEWKENRKGRKRKNKEDQS